MHTVFFAFLDVYSTVWMQRTPRERQRDFAGKVLPAHAQSLTDTDAGEKLTRNSDVVNAHERQWFTRRHVPEPEERPRGGGAVARRQADDGCGLWLAPDPPPVGGVPHIWQLYYLGK